MLFQHSHVLLTYSQAVAVGETLYLSGQIGLDPNVMYCMCNCVMARLAIND